MLDIPQFPPRKPVFFATLAIKSTRLIGSPPSFCLACGLSFLCTNCSVRARCLNSGTPTDLIYKLFVIVRGPECPPMVPVLPTTWITNNNYRWLWWRKLEASHEKNGYTRVAGKNGKTLIFQDRRQMKGWFSGRFYDRDDIFAGVNINWSNWDMNVDNDEVLQSAYINETVNALLVKKWFVL